MKPTFKEFKEIEVIGIEGRFIAIVSPDANNLKVIPALWKTFFPRRHEITGAATATNLGLSIPLEDEDKESHVDEMLYVACTEVKAGTTIPEGMVRKTIPAGSYAMFTHKGPVETIGETLGFIYGQWLPQSKKVMRDAPHLEIYDERFKLGSADSEIDIGVPIE